MSGRFEGWYHKLQANGKSLAVIPGRADDGAFVHIVTDDRAYSIPYTGDNTFSERGISLNIHHPELTLTGEIKFVLQPINASSPIFARYFFPPS